MWLRVSCEQSLRSEQGLKQEEAETRINVLKRSIFRSADSLDVRDVRKTCCSDDPKLWLDSNNQDIQHWHMSNLTQF